MAAHDGRGLAATAQAALLDDPEFLRGVVQRAVQAILEAGMDVHLGAGRYERSAGRTGYRPPRRTPIWRWTPATSPCASMAGW